MSKTKGVSSLIPDIIWSDIADKMRGVKAPASPRRATLTPLILPALSGNQAALSRNLKIASRVDRRAVGSGARHWQKKVSLQIKYNPPYSVTLISTCFYSISQTHFID